MKSFMLFLFVPFVCGIPAFADVTITSPASQSQVVSPFHLVATASNCSSQPVTSIGYSIDNNGNPTVVNGSSIDTYVSYMTGGHTVNVTSYGKRGAVCSSSVSFIVVQDPATQVPSDASVYKNIQARSDWQGTADASISGSTASGTTTLVSSPSLSGSARQFAMQYTNYGAERYWVVFGSNTGATNFLYDGWIYMARPSNHVANIETDVDQVMSNAETVIYGFQCDGYNGTWDYTENAGTAQAYSDHWLRSSDACNPRSWSTNTWHHLQISFSRDDSGSVTYHSVWFDGVEQDIGATVPSAFDLNWATVLLTNFQIDGYGSSGSATVYLDNLTISCW